MAKLKLELDPDPEVTVIGISSHVNDYRLCWALNRSMGLELTRRREDITDTTDGRMVRYATFDHEVEGTDGRYTLVQNHGADGVLLKDQRQADYFLVVDNAIAEARPWLLDKVRGTEFVLTAFPLAFDQLRAGHKLLL